MHTKHFPHATQPNMYIISPVHYSLYIWVALASPGMILTAPHSHWRLYWDTEPSNFKPAWQPLYANTASFIDVHCNYKWPGMKWTICMPVSFVGGRGGKRRGSRNFTTFILSPKWICSSLHQQALMPIRTYARRLMALGSPQSQQTWYVCKQETPLSLPHTYTLWT